jgi:uncharacterized protein involved in type VI secretion and phage assembly
VGPPFDGQYVCTGARHVFEPDYGGYRTWFTVGGRRDRSLYALASGPATATESTRPNVPSVAVGIVMNNIDPNNEGKVQVMFPWLGPTYVSAWARTVQLGASKLGGSLFIPEVSDEVLCAFDRGDINEPYVIGGLYNGMFKPNPAPKVEGVVAQRYIQSRALHAITFDDGPESIAITIQTGLKTCTIKMDDTQQTLTIQTLGQLKVTAAQGIEFQTPMDFKVTAGGNFTVQAAAGATLESGGAAALKGGGGVTLQGSTVSVQAPSVSLGG